MMRSTVEGLLKEYGPTLGPTLITMVAGFFAWVLGLKAWKRQLRGNAEYEVSRRLLASAYRIRDGIARVREPEITREEQAAALESEGSSTEEIRESAGAPMGLITAYAVRRNALVDLRTALEADAVEANVLWPDAANVALKPLLDCVAALVGSVLEHAKYFHPSVQPNPDEEARLERIVVASVSDDAFKSRVDDAIRQIESFVEGHLRK
jgi:hypothetical protein